MFVKDFKITFRLAILYFLKLHIFVLNECKIPLKNLLWHYFFSSRDADYSDINSIN